MGVDTVSVKVVCSITTLTIVNIYLVRNNLACNWFDELLYHIEPPFLILGNFNFNILHRDAQSSAIADKLLNWMLENKLLLLNTGHSFFICLLVLLAMSISAYIQIHST